MPSPKKKTAAAAATTAAAAARGKPSRGSRQRAALSSQSSKAEPKKKKPRTKNNKREEEVEPPPSPDPLDLETWFPIPEDCGSRYNFRGEYLAGASGVDWKAFEGALEEHPQLAFETEDGHDILEHCLRSTDEPPPESVLLKIIDMNPRVLETRYMHDEGFDRKTGESFVGVSALQAYLSWINEGKCVYGEVCERMVEKRPVLLLEKDHRGESGYETLKPFLGDSWGHIRRKVQGIYSSLDDTPDSIEAINRDVQERVLPPYDYSTNEEEDSGSEEEEGEDDDDSSLASTGPAPDPLDLETWFPLQDCDSRYNILGEYLPGASGVDWEAFEKALEEHPQLAFETEDKHDILEHCLHSTEEPAPKSVLLKIINMNPRVLETRYMYDESSDDEKGDGSFIGVSALQAYLDWIYRHYSDYEVCERMVEKRPVLLLEKDHRGESGYESLKIYFDYRHGGGIRRKLKGLYSSLVDSGRLDDTPDSIEAINRDVQERVLPPDY